MARRLKSIFVYYNHRNLCSVILRIGIFVSITQLVDSLSHGHSDDKDVSTNGKRNSGFKFHTANFDLSFDIFNNENERREFFKPILDSDKDIVHKAIRDGIFYPPGENEDRSKSNSRDQVFLRPRLGDGTDPTILQPNIPEKCRNDFVCEEDLTYPEDAVEEVVKDFTDLRVLAVVDDEPIARRISDDDSTNLCVSNHQTWYPKSVRSSKSEPWHRVVNVQSFKQGVRVGHCQKVDGECSSSFENVEAGKGAVCKQQYSYRQVVVFSPENGTALAKVFPLPSGCCCHSKSTDIVSSHRLSRHIKNSKHLQPWFHRSHNNRMHN